MKRLKAAGLNPHLVYGHGATATAPTQQAPQVDTQAIPQAIQQFQDMAVKNLETDVLKKRLEVMEQQRRLAYENAEQSWYKTEETAMRWGALKGLSAEQGDYFKEKFRTPGLQNRATELSNKAQELANAYKEADRENDLKMAAERLQQAKYKTASTQYEKDLIQARIKNLDTSTAVLETKKLSQEDQAEMLGYTKRMMKANAALLEGKISLQAADQEIKDAEKFFRKLGLSPTAVSDMIELFSGGAIAKKIVEGIGSGKRPRSSNQKKRYDPWGTKTAPNGYDLK